MGGQWDPTLKERLGRAKEIIQAFQDERKLGGPIAIVQGCHQLITHPENQIPINKELCIIFPRKIWLACLRFAPIVELCNCPGRFLAQVPACRHDIPIHPCSIGPQNPRPGPGEHPSCLRSLSMGIKRCRSMPRGRKAPLSIWLGIAGPKELRARLQRLSHIGFCFAAINVAKTVSRIERQQG